MAWCAGNALDMLRFFGVPVHKLQAASATPDKSNKGKGQRQGQDARPKWLFALVGPWLLLSPANIIKIALINKPSPAAMYIVGEGMDKCQAECDIARMWGCLFWALQFCIASGIILTQPHWKQAPVTRVPYVMAKSAVGVRASRTCIVLDQFSDNSMRFHTGGTARCALPRYVETPTSTCRNHRNCHSRDYICELGATATSQEKTMRPVLVCHG